jgi:2-polyprenyl-6-hydroxyphenyl methylase/3-demethylubiquinone-9 3-methyltransferase
MKENLEFYECKNYDWNKDSPEDCHSYVLPTILKLLPCGKHIILDAGCGNGYIAGKLISFGYFVTGIDVSPDGIFLARNAYPNGVFEIRSVYEDLSDLITNVDIVISSEVIEHLYYPNRFLQNMNSILKLGGWLLLSTPYHGWLKNSLISLTGQWDKHHMVDWEGGHIKFFSEKSLTNLLTVNGFENIVFKNAVASLFCGNLLYVRPRRNLEFTHSNNPYL